MNLAEQEEGGERKTKGEGPGKKKNRVKKEGGEPSWEMGVIWRNEVSKS